MRDETNPNAEMLKEENPVADVGLCFVWLI